jgi:hypothetical protein
MIFGRFREGRGRSSRINVGKALNYLACTKWIWTGFIGVFSRIAPGKFAMSLNAVVPLVSTASWIG